jgi:glucose-1-phosphatase
MEPRFVYFDLGNVLLRFSHERAAEQMARAAGVSSERAWQVLFNEGGLEWAYERGNLTREQFYARFCEAVGSRPASDALEHAASDIFELNVPIVALVGHLYATGHSLGIFSNTSPSHWEFCVRRFAILASMFRVQALSFRLHALKPEPAAYAAAARLAGRPPQEIFFTDDRADNVAAARAAGWDAVLFESAGQLHAELRGRGLRFNY